MSRLEKFASSIFPSDPSIGKIGSIEMNIWLAQIVGIPLIGLKEESTSLKFIVIVYSAIVGVLVTLVYMGFELYDLVLCWTDLDALTQNACLSLTHVAGAFKFANTIYHLRDIQKIIEQIRHTAKTYVISDKQRAAFYRGEIENKIPLAIYATLVGFTGVWGMIFLFYNPENIAGQVFPYRVKLPEWLDYELQLAYMGLSVLIYALQVVSLDYLNMLTFDDCPTELRKFHWQRTRPDEQLKSIVQHHCILIQLRNEVEGIFRIPVLLQFFTSLLIFALTGFQATVKSDVDSNGSVMIYFYCGCIFLQLLVYCWFGNDVSEQSKTLGDSGFSSSWYELDERFKKSLLIFLANAQRPFIFTAGGFMSLSLPSFAGILSKSYSFIAVLRNFNGR